jgi:hypothetical protein
VTQTRYNDGSLECRDEFPNNLHNTVPGLCCVEVIETDSDSDRFPDRVTVNRRRLVWTVTWTRYNDGSLECRDEFPNNLHNTVPGLCCVGVVETDSDSDRFPGCVTVNRRRPVWTVTRTRYNDGSLECRDEFPNDLHNTVSGMCCVGVVETDSISDDVQTTSANKTLTNRFLVLVTADKQKLSNRINECPHDCEKKAPSVYAAVE